MMENQTLVQLFESWATTDNPMNSLEEILDWVKEKNKETKVHIRKIAYDYSGFWYYDKKGGGI